MRLTTHLFGYLSRQINHHVPDRTKRLVVLASLSSQLFDRHDYDREYLRKLNALMQLGTGDHALMLPTTLGKAVWKNRLQSTDVVANTPALQWGVIAKELVDMIPNCLRYATDKAMTADITKLLVNQPDFVRT